MIGQYLSSAETKKIKTRCVQSSNLSARDDITLNTDWIDSDGNFIYYFRLLLSIRFVHSVREIVLTGSRFSSQTNVRTRNWEWLENNLFYKLYWLEGLSCICHRSCLFLRKKTWERAVDRYLVPRLHNDTQSKFKFFKSGDNITMILQKADGNWTTR